MADIAIDNSVGRTAYVFGKLYTTGKWFYFPAAILVKATLGFLLLLLLTIPAAGYLWRGKKRETLFLLIPAIFFLAVSMTSKLNFGIRHIPLIFPLLIVLSRGSSVCYLAGRKRGWLYAVVLLAAFHCASSLRAFPYSLSYSNEAFLWPAANLPLSRYELGLGTGLDRRPRLSGAQRHQRLLARLLWPLDPDYYGVPCKVLALYPGNVLARFPLLRRNAHC